jgi:hypothetical protein
MIETIIKSIDDNNKLSAKVGGTLGIGSGVLTIAGSVVALLAGPIGWIAAAGSVAIALSAGSAGIKGIAYLCNKQR